MRPLVALVVATGCVTGDDVIVRPVDPAGACDRTAAILDPIVQRDAAVEPRTRRAQDVGVKLIAILLAVMAGCQPTLRNKQIASGLILAASTAAVACDLGQTLPLAQAGWPGPLREGNWLMGERPSVETLVAYNTGVAVANVGAWWALPKKYDWAVPLALGLVQTVIVAGNAMASPKPFCGLR